MEEENGNVTGSEVDLIQDDPSDNKHLAWVLECEVDFIVSGDYHLSGLEQFEEIKIVTVITFLENWHKHI